jgi:hypothetical protein
MGKTLLGTGTVVLTTALLVAGCGDTNTTSGTQPGSLSR